MTSYFHYFTLLIFSLTLSLSSLAENTTPLADLIYYPTQEINAKTIAIKRSQISPQISGHIENVYVKLGDKVSQGDLLASLDCTLRSQNLAVATAQKQRILQQIRLQEKKLTRQLNLLKTNNVSQTTVDESETNLAISKASLNEQNARIESLSYTQSLCQVRSPFDGTIVEKQAEIGQSASPSSTLFSLLDKQKYHIEVNIPQSLFASFQAAKNFYFILNDKRLAAKKAFILPEFNQNRTLKARLNTEKSIMIGTHGTLQWQEVIPYLPRKYLKREKLQLGIYILDGDKKRFYAIKNAQEGRDNPIELALNTPVIIH